MPFASMSRLRRILVLFGVASVGCVLVLFLAEAAIRVRAVLRNGSVWGIQEFLTIDPATQLRVPVAGGRFGPIEINSLGFRGPEIAVPKPAGTIRIAFLGASTTFCGEVSSNAASWPDLVVQELRRAHPNVPFDYVNGGVPGFGVAASRANLRGRVERLEPDVIVIYHATNDLSSNSFELAREQGLIRERPDMQRSWLSHYSLLVRLVEMNLTIRSRQRMVDVPAGKLRLDLPRLTAPFRNELSALVSEARGAARVVAVATFSTHYRRGQTPATQLAAANTSLYYMPFMTVEALLESFDAYNRAITQIAEAQGVVLIGGADEIPGDPVHFHDSVHFTDAGSIVMASRVTRALESSEAFLAIVERP